MSWVVLNLSLCSNTFRLLPDDPSDPLSHHDLSESGSGLLTYYQHSDYFPGDVLPGKVEGATNASVSEQYALSIRADSLDQVMVDKFLGEAEGTLGRFPGGCEGGRKEGVMNAPVVWGVCPSNG